MGLVVFAFFIGYLIILPFLLVFIFLVMLCGTKRGTEPIDKKSDAFLFGRDGCCSSDGICCFVCCPWNMLTSPVCCCDCIPDQPVQSLIKKIKKVLVCGKCKTKLTMEVPVGQP